jgi:hypothetical protein
MNTAIQMQIDQLMKSILSLSLDELLEMQGAKKTNGVHPVTLRVEPEVLVRRGRPPGSKNKKTTSSGRLIRRGPAEIAEAIERIVLTLAEYPDGLRSEALQKETGFSKKEIGSPIAQALASGQIRKTGQKRATTYFVAAPKKEKTRRKGKKARVVTKTVSRSKARSKKGAPASLKTKKSRKAPPKKLKGAIRKPAKAPKEGAAPDVDERAET